MIQMQKNNIQNTNNKMVKIGKSGDYWLKNSIMSQDQLDEFKTFLLERRDQIQMRENKDRN